MKNSVLNCFIFCAFALFTQNIQAQTISAADQAGITACYNAFMAAFEKLDAAAIGPLLTENAEQIIPTGEIVRGRANIVASMEGYMAFLKTQPKPDRMETKNVAQQNRYLSTDLILTTYTEESTLYFGDKSRTEKMTTSVIMRKINGKWLADLITLTPVMAMPEMGK